MAATPLRFARPSKTPAKFAQLPYLKRHAALSGAQQAVSGDARRSAAGGVELAELRR